eukprot:7389178-Prymnesium_polylepis.2
MGRCRRDPRETWASRWASVRAVCQTMQLDREAIWRDGNQRELVGPCLEDVILADKRFDPGQHFRERPPPRCCQHRDVASAKWKSIHVSHPRTSD